MKTLGARPDTAATGDVPATLALTAVTVTWSLALSRLFSDGRWVAPTLASAAAVHAVSWACRRRRVGLPTTLILSGAAVGLLATWMVLGASTTLGIPTPETWRAATSDATLARAAFSRLTAPVPAIPGFVLASMAGTWLLGFLADWAAFRLASAFQALVPTVAGTVFVAVMGTGSRRLELVGLWLAAMMVFTAAHGVWLRTGGTAGRLPAGTVGVSVAVVVVAVLVGPAVPGAKSAAVIGLRHGSSGGQRTTVSPLVDIQPRLLNESNQLMFTVTSSAPEYWRLTALDHFDGQVWSSDDSYDQSSGSALPVVPAVGADRVTQQFDVSALGSIWLPAAYLPVRVEQVKGLSFDPISQSAITPASTTDGQSYTVVSDVPNFTAAQLRAVDGEATVPPVDLARYTSLPPIPADVRQLAETITFNQPTIYDKALALQDYLRTHETYDLHVPAGHSTSALESFLFVSHRGYCEQFAGAYAVMARAVHIPTRVAVGFTPGVAGPGDQYSVYGFEAHAWPEVLIGEAGWVAFDPTPGRGIPGSQGYTGVAPQQASPPAGLTATTTTSLSPSGGSAPTTGPRGQLNAGIGSTPHTSHGAGGGRSGWALAAAGLVAAVAAWAVGVPAVRLARRRLLRRRAVSEAERVLTAWREAADVVAAAGAPVRPNDTFLDHAGRAAGRLTPVAAEAFTALADRAGAAAWGPSPAAGQAAAAQDLAAVVEHEVHRSAGWRRRLAWAVDPRVGLSSGAGGRTEAPLGH